MAIWNLINRAGKAIAGVFVDAKTKEDALTYSRELYDCDDVDLDRDYKELPEENKKWSLWTR